MDKLQLLSAETRVICVKTDKRNEMQMMLKAIADDFDLFRQLPVVKVAAENAVNKAKTVSLRAAKLRYLKL